MSKIPLPPFAALKAFDAFGRLGGIRKAARALGISHAIVSRHLRNLEAHLGIALVDRNRSALTHEGRDYHQRVAKALEELTDATDALVGRQVQRLHIWCVPGFAYHWLTRRLGSFRDANPSIELDLRPTDSGPDFSANEADGDIRYVRDSEESQSQSGIRAIELARPRIFPVASPECAARLAGHIQTAQDFLATPLIQESDDVEWRAWLQAQGIAAGELKPVARLWHAHLALSAAREGQGIALANDYLIGDDITTRRLVRIVPARSRLQPTAIGAYTFLAREDRWRKETLTRFREWLKATIDADQDSNQPMS